MQPLEIGVCSWSIDRRDPLGSIRSCAGDLGVFVCHLGFFDEPTLASASAVSIAQTCQQTGVQISATFAAFEGEEYDSIATVAATGGYMPDELFEARLDFTRRVADLTVELGVTMLAIHVGSIPQDDTTEPYARLLQRAGMAADLLADRNLTLLLETGREPARGLLQFIDRMHRDNVAINYDPGNMILYGTGDPIAAAKDLRSEIAHVHLKDAVASNQPGQTFGTEASLGNGDANIPRVVSKLRAGGYRGPLIVERTSGRGDAGTLQDSVDYLRTLLE
ncbi:MAG: sugar phosphate isomerase/epimerase family protein [Phycisphaerae bacterium]